MEIVTQEVISLVQKTSYLRDVCPHRLPGHTTLPWLQGSWLLAKAGRWPSWRLIYFLSQTTKMTQRAGSASEGEALVSSWKTWNSYGLEEEQERYSRSSWLVAGLWRTSSSGSTWGHRSCGWSCVEDISVTITMPIYWNHVCRTLNWVLCLH